MCCSVLLTVADKPNIIIIINYIHLFGLVFDSGRVSVWGEQVPMWPLGRLSRPFEHLRWCRRVSPRRRRNPLPYAFLAILMGRPVCSFMSDHEYCYIVSFVTHQRCLCNIFIVNISLWFGFRKSARSEGKKAELEK